MNGIILNEHNQYVPEDDFLLPNKYTNNWLIFFHFAVLDGNDLYTSCLIAANKCNKYTPNNKYWTPYIEYYTKLRRAK